MTTLQTPSTIEVLIHCHCTPTPHPRNHAPAVQDAIRELLEYDAIESAPEDGENCYRTTPLGAAWLNALERVPIPRLVYVDTDGHVLG
jgi:hypothetical protein